MPGETEFLDLGDMTTVVGGMLKYSFNTMDFPKERLGKEAQFMLNCLVQWGMVSSYPSGEDTGGRSKRVLMDPSEVARRAAEMTAAAFAEMRARGWVHAGIDPRSLYETEGKE